MQDTAKQNDTRPTVNAGCTTGALVDAAQVDQLASMPSREQMLAQLAGGMQAPLAAFVGAMGGVLYMFAGALEGLRTQREGAGPTST